MASDPGGAPSGVDDAAREALAAALVEDSEEHAGLVLSDKSDVALVPQTVFQRHRIFEVTYRAAHPIRFYVGWAEGEPARILTGAPESFVALAYAERLALDSAEAAAAYAALYFETTHSRRAPEYLVRSVDDLKFLPEPNARERAAQARARAHFAPVITPPTARPANGSGWVATLYVVRQQELRRLTLTISHSGEVKSSATTLARNLPLAYGR